MTCLACTPVGAYLSDKGYAIPKSGNDELVNQLKKTLTVSPKVNPSMPNSEPTKFAVYRENDTNIYLPRVYGLKEFGVPTKKSKLSAGDDAPGLVFNGGIREEQRAPVDAFISAAKDPARMGGIISIGCGGGKCLGKDTPVLMNDGSIKMSQDIRVGDVLMGDDSGPRNVKSTCTGREVMYKITPARGKPYIVNKSHILSLKCVGNTTLWKKGKVVDISITDFLALPKTYHGLMYGYRVPVAFPPVVLPDAEDPYAVGAGVSIDTTEPLPMHYRCGSTAVRTQVLAGLIDAYGKLNRMGGYDVISSNGIILDDIAFIAGSLGFGAFIDKKNLKCLSIIGRGIEKLPIRVAKNKVKTPKNIKYVSKNRIRLEELPEDDYYGFEIDGNRRFLLGDFTVTHNTVIGLHLASVFKKKTLIVCHKEFLMNQWRERIGTFLPGARVGMIKQSKVDVANKDIVVASLQSLAMRDYDKSIFKQFGMVIYDECHHNGAEVFSQSMSKMNMSITLGLSATLDRKDGLRKVFEWHLGAPVFESKKRGDSEVIVKMIKYFDKCPDYSRERLMFNGKRNTPQMMNAICAYLPRNAVILDALQAVLLAEPERKVIVLSDRRAHLTALAKEIEARNMGSYGFYVGGMKQEALKESEGKDIILGTYTLVSEGFDVPALNTLVFASPISSIEQSVGRIQRQKASERKFTPLIIDLWDDFSMYRNQGFNRIKFYKKNGYTIQCADTDGLDVSTEPEDTSAKVMCDFIDDD